MSEVLVHHCKSQEYIAQGLDEPPAKKCTCRQMMTYKTADAKVKLGEARYVVTKRERGNRDVPCRLCKGNPEIANCAHCKGKGTEEVTAIWETYDDRQIVFVSQASIDAKEKKYRPALAMKTPRVATVESKHIMRAYVDGNKEAQARIEEYGDLIQDSLGTLGAELREKKSGKIIKPGNPEPANNPRTGEGRDYDYGRSI
jgi:hypothetical protein